MMVGFQCQLVLFLYYFKKFKRQSVLFCFVTRFQRRLVLLGHEISMRVGFHCQLVLFCYEIAKTVGFVFLLFYKI